MKKSLKIDPSIAIKRLRIVTSRLVNAKFVGSYKSVFKGRGLEFLDYRQYNQGDDASMIDWKASVKSDKLLVKEFTEERNLNVFFLIDVSSSMFYGSEEKLKIEYAAELVATLSYTILKAGDGIGFAFFTDKIVRYEPIATGIKQYFKLINSIIEPRFYGGNYDLNEALKFALGALKNFSIVIIVSDFIGLKNGWEHYAKMVGRKFDLIAIMVRDPRDMELPSYSGNVVFEDVYSNKQLIANVGLIQEKYAKYNEMQEKSISKVFVEAKSDFLRLSTDKQFIKPITDLFSKRMSRMTASSKK